MSEGGRDGARKKLREAACNAVAGGSAGYSAPNSPQSPRFAALVVMVFVGPDSFHFWRGGCWLRADLRDGSLPAGRDQDAAAGVRPPFQPLLRRCAAWQVTSAHALLACYFCLLCTPFRAYLLPGFIRDMGDGFGIAIEVL